MASYETLKAAIRQVVTTNGNNEITGALLQSLLISVVDSLGAGYQYMGLATPATNPGTPDQRVFYIAVEPGNYANFGLTVNEGEMAILIYSTSWQKETLPFVSATVPVIRNHVTDTIGGYVRDDNGNYVSASGYNVTDFVKMQGASSITIKNSHSNQYHVASYVFYDINKNYISSSPTVSSGTDYPETVLTEFPEGAFYIRCCSTTRQQFSLDINFNLLTVLDTIFDGLADLADEVQDKTNITDEYGPTLNGYVRRDNGNFVSTNQFAATDFIDVNGADRLIVTQVLTNQYNVGAYVFYTAEKAYISSNPAASGTQRISGEISIPANAAFVRCSFAPNDSPRLVEVVRSLKAIVLALQNEISGFENQFAAKEDVDDINNTLNGQHATLDADLSKITESGFYGMDMSVNSNTAWVHGPIKLPYGTKQIVFNNLPAAQYSQATYNHFVDSNGNSLSWVRGNTFLGAGVVTLDVPVGAVALLFNGSTNDIASYNISLVVDSDGLIADVNKIAQANYVLDLAALIPDTIYAVIGTELNLWNDAISLSIDRGLVSPLNYTVEWLCNRGMVTARGFRFLPGANDTGTIECTCVIYSTSNHAKLAEKTFNIVVLAKGALSSPKNIIHFGDSLGAQTAIQLYGNFHNADRFTGIAPTMYGTKGTTPKYEAVGGNTWRSYATSGRISYRLTVTGVGSLNVGAIYAYSGTNYEIREVNLNEGAGEILLSKSDGTAGNLAGVGSGTITRVSGSGDSSIAFSGNSTESGNPLWNPTTNKLDLAYYKTQIGMAASAKIDAATFQFGVNESLGTPDFESIFTNYIVPLYNLFVADNASFKFIIGLTTSAGNDVNGAGVNYGAGCNTWNYLSNVYEFRKMYLDKFALGDYPNMIIAPSGLFVDRYYGYAFGDRAISQRDADTEKYHINYVHPAASGYGQLADALFATFIGALI